MTATAPFGVANAPDLGRFRLRPVAASDLDAMARVWSDPAVVGPLSAKPFSREDVWRRLLSYIGHWQACRYGVFGVAHLIDGSDYVEAEPFVGEVGFFRYERAIGADFDDGDEMGWTFGSAYHGRGLALAASLAALQWFDAMRPGRLVCMIAPGNAPSLKLAGRLGFSPYREARFKGSPVVLLERAARV